MIKLPQGRTALVIGGLVVILALVGVLVATVVRIQQPKPTIELPRATGPTDCNRVCRNADQAGECVGWCNRYQQGGQCPNLNGVNCSNLCSNFNTCVAKCQEVLAAVNAGTCKAGGTGGGGGGAGGGGVQPSGGGGPVKVFVKDKSNNCQPFAQSTTVRMGSTTTCPTGCNSQCSDPVCNPNREQTYNPSTGFVTWNTSVDNSTYVFFLKDLPAPKPKCTLTSGSGDSSCTIAVNGQEGDCSGGGGTGGCSTDADCSSGKVCVDGSCMDKSKTHLDCVGNACVHAEGTGSDLNGCTGVGAACTTSGNVCSEADKCWGNGGVNGKCYDCNGDGVINILDFSCFAGVWLQGVSGEKPAACSQ